MGEFIVTLVIAIYTIYLLFASNILYLILLYLIAKSILLVELHEFLYAFMIML